MCKVSLLFYRPAQKSQGQKGMGWFTLLCISGARIMVLTCKCFPGKGKKTIPTETPTAARAQDKATPLINHILFPNHILLPNPILFPNHILLPNHILFPNHSMSIPVTPLWVSLLKATPSSWHDKPTLDRALLLAVKKRAGALIASTDSGEH